MVGWLVGWSVGWLPLASIVPRKDETFRLKKSRMFFQVDHNEHVLKRIKASF